MAAVLRWKLANEHLLPFELATSRAKTISCTVSQHSYTQGLAKPQETGSDNLKHLQQGGSQSVYEQTYNSLPNMVYGLSPNRDHWPKSTTVHMPLHFCHAMDDTAANSVGNQCCSWPHSMIPHAVDIADGHSVSTHHQIRPTDPGFEIMGVEYSMSSEGIVHKYAKEFSIPKETTPSVLHSVEE